jgi:hypothetical protein
LTARSFFVGWWAGDTNKIARKDPRFLQHGLHPPDFEEREMIEQVKEQYGHKITAEQLAWIRWKTESAGAGQPCWTRTSRGRRCSIRPDGLLVLPDARDHGGHEEAGREHPVQSDYRYRSMVISSIS